MNPRSRAFLGGLAVGLERDSIRGDGAGGGYSGVGRPAGLAGYAPGVTCRVAAFKTDQIDRFDSPGVLTSGSMEDRRTLAADPALLGPEAGRQTTRARRCGSLPLFGRRATGLKPGRSNQVRREQGGRLEPLFHDRKRTLGDTRVVRILIRYEPRGLGNRNARHRLDIDRQKRGDRGVRVEQDGKDSLDRVGQFAKAQEIRPAPHRGPRQYRPPGSHCPARTDWGRRQTTHSQHRR